MSTVIVPWRCHSCGTEFHELSGGVCAVCGKITCHGCFDLERRCPPCAVHALEAVLQASAGHIVIVRLRGRGKVTLQVPASLEGREVGKINCQEMRQRKGEWAPVGDAQATLTVRDIEWMKDANTRKMLWRGRIL